MKDIGMYIERAPRNSDVLGALLYLLGVYILLAAAQPQFDGVVEYGVFATSALSLCDLCLPLIFQDGMGTAKSLLRGTRPPAFIFISTLVMVLFGVGLMSMNWCIEHVRWIPEYQFMQRSKGPLLWWDINSFVLGPAGETMLMLGFLFPWLKSKCNWKLALLGIAVAWVSFHHWAYSGRWSLVTIEFLIFYGFGISFKITGSLVPAFLAHGVVNFLIADVLK